jgi:hypothetical protein
MGYMNDKINELQTSSKEKNQEIYIEPLINLRRVTNLELTW